MIRPLPLVLFGLIPFIGADSGHAKEPSPDALRKEVAAWLKKNTRPAEDTQLAEVFSRMDKDIAKGQYFVLTLGPEVMKSGKPFQVYGFADQFFTFKLRPAQVKRLGLEQAGVSYATAGARGLNRREATPLVKLGKPRVTSDRAGGKINGQIVCRTVLAKAGKYGLRVSYQVDGEWTQQLFPLKKLPKKKARLRFALDRIGKGKKPYAGPVVLFLDVCSVREKNGQASFAIHSNTVGKLIDVGKAARTSK
jgi:hypothetical protein